jgi:hypothetical protein
LQTFDYANSRLLLVSRDRPPLWRNWPWKLSTDFCTWENCPLSLRPEVFTCMGISFFLGQFLCLLALSNYHCWCDILFLHCFPILMNYFFDIRVIWHTDYAAQ